MTACLVPDAPFRGAAPPVAAPAAPSAPYVVDPVSGGRLAVAPTRSAPTASAMLALGSADEEVRAFAAAPQHPLFELVRADMARLMRQGRAADLQSAYDQAVAARAASFRAESARQRRTPDDAASRG